MKRVFIILLGLMPFLGFSQISIVTTAGDTIKGYIRYSSGKKIEFYDKIKSLNSYSIPVKDISIISGNMIRVKTNVLKRANPSIIFNPNSPVPITGSKILNFKTAGDLLKQSAYLRLSSFGVGILTSTLLIVGIDEWESQEVSMISFVGGTLSLGLYIAGEVTLIKAGDKMNRDAVYLSMADNGLGIAIKF